MAPRKAKPEPDAAPGDDIDDARQYRVEMRGAVEYRPGIILKGTVELKGSALREVLAEVKTYAPV
jgi:hypothetical protein